MCARTKPTRTQGSRHEATHSVKIASGQRLLHPNPQPRRIAISGQQNLGCKEVKARGAEIWRRMNQCRDGVLGSCRKCCCPFRRVGGVRGSQQLKLAVKRSWTKIAFPSRLPRFPFKLLKKAFGNAADKGARDKGKHFRPGQSHPQNN